MTIFDWCVNDRHAECAGSYERFIIDPRTNKVVWLDEEVACECKKRGCDCYTKPADRVKKKTTRRRKK